MAPILRPEYDFIPELELNHPAQNEAGTCQSYHQCNNDTDCITQLGWEYSCLDINELRSHWLKFNVDGKEKENSQLANQSWDQILNGGILSENSKRCVYRGMGALCKQDYTNLSATSSTFKRPFDVLLTFIALIYLQVSLMITSYALQIN